MTQTSNTTQSRFSRGLLSGMRIRKKLIVLHTAFSISLGALLLIAIRPAMSKVIVGAEYDLSEQAVKVILDASGPLVPFRQTQLDQTQIVMDAQPGQDFSDSIGYQARLNPTQAIPIPSDGFASGVVKWIPSSDSFLLVRARSQRARDTIQLVYILVIATLVAGYGLVAAALEIFVLPQHVYRPIRALLAADSAVPLGDRNAEIIPEHAIPADELGSIMRSRNESIHALRTHERDLAKALDRLEHTAADLHKKNYLLETARKNLEGADRLASLGMMSAGIAHELNTPLAVVKGLVEKLNANKELSLTEIALLSRVVSRLEKLSDGLLDFARVRPQSHVQADIRTLVDEAITLVKIDRKEQLNAHKITIRNQIQPETLVPCDPDRIIQVFVNLVRNGVDAISTTRAVQGFIEISAYFETRESTPWINIKIQDSGPGIDSSVIDRLFEPFVSSNLDSHGTGLGLAVANGIIREHGGLLVATNRSPSGHDQDHMTGAVFELILPIENKPLTSKTDKDIL